MKNSDTKTDLDIGSDKSTAGSSSLFLSTTRHKTVFLKSSNSQAILTCTHFLEITCLLTQSRVFLLGHVSSHSVTCLLTQSRVFSLSHVSSHSVTCLLTQSRIFSLSHVPSYSATCLLTQSRVFSLSHVSSHSVTCLLTQ